jgi:phage host-nuclease inhibitor protein Gam
MNNLAHFEDELFPEEAQAEGFVVDSMDKAEWALSKIARSEHRISMLSELAAKAKARIDARLEQITKGDRASVANLGEMIRPWAEVEVAKNEKRKSIQLLGGVVGFRQSPGRVEVTDEAAAISWLLAKNESECIRIKQEINKIAVKKRIEQTGELPAGITFAAGEVRFYIEAARPEIESKEKNHG